MRRSTLLLGTLGGIIVVFGGAVAGLSTASSGKIASGIHVEGVQLGGLTPEEARDRLSREYLVRVQTPIVVERRGRQFILSSKEARITADLDATVNTALELSKSDNVVEQAWRAVRGVDTDQSLEVKAAPSRAAVLRFVDRVRREVDRQPVPARLAFDGNRPVVRASQTGMVVDRQKLAALVTEAAANPQRTPMLVPVRTKRPSVSERQLRRDHGTILVVNRSTHKLYLYKAMKVSKTYGVAVGKAGQETPAGTYTINDKQVNPTWYVPNSDWAGDLAGTVVPPGPSNPIKARWMGFFNAAGIHGTTARDSIGSAASHGCVRMLEEDVIDLYDRVPLGTTIHVI